MAKKIGNFTTSLVDFTQDCWLSKMVGKQAYSLSFDRVITSKTLPLELESLRCCLSDMGECFVSAKTAPDDIGAIELLTEAGFRLIDTNLVFAKRLEGRHTLPEPVSGVEIRNARPEEREAVMAVASEAFVCSRFHLDPRIGPEVADRIKAGWAENYFSGERGDAMVVALVDGVVAGFLQLLFSRPVLTIDLVAVASAFKGRGMASRMIRFAEASCGEFGEERVGTQLANTPSIALYHKLGFRLAEGKYVFHYHGGRSEACSDSGK